MNDNLPLQATIEAGLATTTRATLGTVTLVVADFTTSEASSVATGSTAFGTITLRVTNLATAEAGTTASTATSLVAEAAGRAPAVVARVSRCEVKIAIGSDARSLFTPVVDSIVVGLGVLLVLLRLLKSAVSLGVLVLRPVAGLDGAITELAESVAGHLLLHTVVWVRYHARRHVEDLSVSHSCCLYDCRRWHSD